MESPLGNETPGPAPTPRRFSLWSMLAIVGATVLMIGGAVAGVSSIASAADGPTTTSAETTDAGEATIIRTAAASPVSAVAVADTDVDDEAFDDEYFELSPEDEAIFEAFETCLTDNGLDEQALDTAEANGELTEADYDAIDAAFETCEPILDDLSDDAHWMIEDDEYFELSPEDEAIFEAFETCLTDNGLDEQALDTAEANGELTEADYDAIDAAFETCEPILDDLSDDAHWMIELEECEDAFEDHEEWLEDGEDSDEDGDTADDDTDAEGDESA